MNCEECCGAVVEELRKIRIELERIGRGQVAVTGRLETVLCTQSTDGIIKPMAMEPNSDLSKGDALPIAIVAAQNQTIPIVTTPSTASGTWPAIKK